ncbi:MAG TPA: RidA family protein, partial [Trueperaceae bacterium]
MEKTPEERYERFCGRTLPVPADPRGAYVPAVEHKGMMMVSGQTPSVRGEPQFQGRLGDSLDLEEGKAAARIAIGNALGALKAHLGDLSRVARILQLVGYVRSTDDFTQHTEVIDGAS